MPEDVRRLNYNETLHANVTPAKGNARARILVFHGGGGVGGNPEMIQPFCDRLVAEGGIEIYAARYRTLNADGANLSDMRADAAAALGAARQGLGAEQTLFVLGASFGGLLALDAVAAAPQDVAGLILLNAVTDTGPDGFSNRVVAEGGAALSPLARWEGSPLPGRMRCLLLHGGKDDVVPVEASRRFAALWPQGRAELVEYPDATHGFFNRDAHGAKVAARIARFVEGARTASAPAEPLAATEAAPAASLLPEGVSILYGIGAQKAGTTWLSQYLARHPEVHPGPIKELHYFDTLHAPSERIHLENRLKALQKAVSRLVADFSPSNRVWLGRIEEHAGHLSIYSAERGDHRAYAAHLLRGRGAERMVYDITPSYSTLDRTAFADMDGVGPAKFIFLMREPVSRMWSQIRMMQRAANREQDDAAFETGCIALARELHESGRLARIPRADYARTIRELEAAIPPERIHYTFHHDPMPQDAADKICDFLGIERQPITDKLRTNVGRGLTLPAEVEKMMVEAFRPQYEFATERFGVAVPDEWHRRFARPQLAPAPRAGIVQRLFGRARRGIAPRVVKSDTTIVFLHIPKTAGQTIVSEIRRIVGRQAMSPVRTHSEAPPDAQMPQGYRVHAGHIDWVDLDNLPEDRFAFSVLRDPRERIASFYFYLLREAGKLTPQELQKRERTGMRRMLEVTPDDYFFGGDRAWQRFIRDHYDNFYANYFITRRIRGWKQISDMSDADRLEKAFEGTGALQRIYSVDDLAPLETDLERILGKPLKLTGNYRNSGPEAGRTSRWGALIDRFEDKSLEERLDAFAAIDRQLMKRLGLG